MKKVNKLTGIEKEFFKSSVTIKSLLKAIRNNTWTSTSSKSIKNLMKDYIAELESNG